MRIGFMKKIILYVCVMIVLLACKHQKVSNQGLYLHIQNQSSFSLKSVEFNGATFEGKKDKGFILKVADKGSIKLKEASSAYVYFSIISSISDEEILVRSNEVVSIDKDGINIFVITDNTLVSAVATNIKSTVFGIISPARLKVVNHTSCNIEGMSFSGRSKKEAFLINEVWQTDFSDDVSGTLSFKLVNPKDNKTFDVSIEEKINIKTGEIKEVELDNASLVLYEEKIRVIGSILGVSAISIVNNSSTEISNLKLAGQAQIQALKKAEVWKLGSYEDINEALHFEVQTKAKTFKLRTASSVSCRIGEFKTFFITDDLIIDTKDHDKPLRLGDLLAASIITISNKSSVEILSVSYSDMDFGNIPHDASERKLVWNAQGIARPIYFSVYQDTSDTTVKITTKEEFLINSGEEKTIIVTDLDLVFPEGSIDDVELEKLPFAARLTIVNKSIAKLLNVSYANASFGAIDTDVEKTFVFLKNTPIKQKINFVVKTKDGLVTLQTKDEISLVKGKTVSYTIENNSVVVIKDTDKSEELKNVLKLCVLNIENNTGKDLRELKIAGEVRNKVLSDNETWKVGFMDDVQDVLKFSLVTSVHTVNVSTKEKITLTETEEKTFSISGDTLVVVEGSSNDIKLEVLLNASALNIANGSSKELFNVEYDTLKFGNLKPRDEQTITKMEDTTLQAQITFEVQVKNKRIRLRTKNYVFMKDGRLTTYTITNSTPLIVIETNEEKTIKDFIEKAVLKVVNKSSFILDKLEYANQKKYDYDDLNKDEFCQFEFEEEVAGYFRFRISLPNFGEVAETLQFKKVFFITNGELETVVITDDAKVRDDGKTKKLSDFLDVARLDVRNKTYKKLEHPKFIDIEIKSSYYYDPIKPFDYVLGTILNFPKAPGNISFEVEVDKDNKKVRVKTKDTISLIKQKKVSYNITMKTIVIREDTGEELAFGSLLKQIDD